MNTALTTEEEALLSQVLEEIEAEHRNNAIPENSKSLLVDEATSRFSSAIWYEAIQKQVIMLAGCGGIGRFGNLIN